MALELIDKPECPFCWKVRLALHESSLDYAIIPFESESAQERIQHLEYGGTFPVLFDDDVVIVDSSIACGHIVHVYNPGLLPESPSLRVQAQTLEHFASHEVGKAMRKIVLEKRGKTEAEWDLNVIREGEALWEGYQRQLSKWLGDREFFAEGYSLAETALLPRFALAERYGSPIKAEHTNLQNWYQRQLQRPSFSATSPWRTSA